MINKPNNTLEISTLKNYISEVISIDDSSENIKIEKKGKKVAVIGAGPTGLSTAYFLQKIGYQVHVYESLPCPGGVLDKADFSLEDLKKEIKPIASLGVKFFYNVHIGEDITIDVLDKNYDSIVVAIGANINREYPCFIDNDLKNEKIHLIGEVLNAGIIIDAISAAKGITSVIDEKIRKNNFL